MTASRDRKIAAENHLRQEEMVLFGCQQQIWSCFSPSGRYSSHFGALKHLEKVGNLSRSWWKTVQRGFGRVPNLFAYFGLLSTAERRGLLCDLSRGGWCWRQVKELSSEQRVRQGPTVLIPTEETCEGYGHSGQLLWGQMRKVCSAKLI